MRKVFFMFFVMFSFSLFAQEANIVSQENPVSEEKKLCEKNAQRLKHKLRELSDKNREKFNERIKNEFAICKSDEKCVCEIYTYMLSEIDKSESKNTPEPANKAKTVPEKSDAEKIEELEEMGMKKKRMGKGLLIPGIILDSIGFIFIFIVLPIEATVTHNNEMIVVAGSVGGATAFIGLNLTIPGAVAYSKGKRLLRKADKLKSKNDVSFRLTPVIEPKSKYYGAAFSMSF